MRDEDAGGLELIDGPCKYGHYHLGCPHLHPHYSLSAEAPNFMQFSCARNVNVVKYENTGTRVVLSHPESRCF